MRIADVDFSLLPDAITEVREHLQELEYDLHRLVQSPDSNDLLSSAFRHMHTIKGDFGYCNAMPIVEFIHHLEGVMQSLRSHQFACSALVAEAIVQSMDQVQNMMETLLQTRQFDQIPRTVLAELIQKLAASRNQPEADQAARHILLAATDENLGEPRTGIPLTLPASKESIAHALILGRQLCAALEARQPLWAGRALQQQALVSALNKHYLYPCNTDALDVAVCWHDVGLLACSDAALESSAASALADQASYVMHPERAASWLLSIAPDCIEAAQIIRQHHLWINGSGIAAPQYGLPPHPGALMLSCADVWFDRVAGLNGEEFRRGVLRALFDVNAGFETHFDSALISAFENVARSLVSIPA